MFMADVLLVYKKNFEGIHDESLQVVKGVLNDLSDTLRVDIRAREQVRRADFIGRDLVIVPVSYTHLTLPTILRV